MTSCLALDCERPARGMALCKACTKVLEKRLAELPALIEDLLVTLTRQTRTSENGTRSGNPVLVVNLAAADVMADLTRNLEVTIRHIRQPGEPIPKPANPSRARWLYSRVQRIRLDPEAGNILDGLNAITRRLWAVVDLPEDKRTFPVGLCPEEVDGKTCEGVIRAHIPREDGLPAKMRCTACGVVYETWQWLRAGKRIRPRPAPEPPEVRPAPSGSVKGGRHTSDANMSILDGTMFT